MLPTRADSTAIRLRSFSGSRSKKCFSTSAGPIVLTANACASVAGSRSARRFSGERGPRLSTPVAHTTTCSAPASRRRTAAAAMLPSSVRSNDGVPLRASACTWAQRGSACKACTSALPMAPLAPMTAAR